ncbi:hypothetical protein SHJG_8690 [Streptomyces hygroscopicus subsp. jinggangensis 5008]|nr:hypothetical protein SHJG_8690 [Streptomyces hygroscopicus subsp. jinggangensis 5008]AGF68112.1 hypothetical protein SHJGH_8450 [Streptomyces hygroscopicus subsp. jinggangensis TL01]
MRSVATVVDGYEDLDLDEIDFVPMETEGKRLPLLALQEAHDLLNWLRLVTAESGARAPEAGRWAKEIAARVPSQE